MLVTQNVVQLRQFTENMNHYLAITTSKIEYAVKCKWNHLQNTVPQITFFKLKKKEVQMQENSLQLHSAFKFVLLCHTNQLNPSIVFFLYSIEMSYNMC